MIEPVRQPGRELIRQLGQGPTQLAAPQAAFQRAQGYPDGLRPADLLTLQRTVGNRMVQRATAQRAVSMKTQAPAKTAQLQDPPEEQELLQGKFAPVRRKEPEQGELQTKKSSSTPTHSDPAHVSYPLPRSVGSQAVARLVQRFSVYRGGPHEAANYVRDMSGPKRGLSTFEIIADIPANYRPAQQIETDNLGADLETVRNGGGNNSHVSIVPTNDRMQQPNNPPQPPPAASTKKKKPPQPKPTYEKLTAWAQGGVAHPYTTAVMNARNGEMP
jgi:hypothetical protein